MNKYAAYILALTLPFTMMACSKSGSSAGNDPSNNIDEAAKDPDLQTKIFRGDCSLKPLEAIASGIATAGGAVIKGAREQYQIVGANITHATLMYTAADCTGTESLIFKEYGTISISKGLKSSEGATFIDITNLKLGVQAADDAGTLVANELKLCSREDWSNHDEKDVTAASADANCYRRPVPNNDANIYLIEGNTLYFGERGVFDKKNERPEKIDRENKYVAN